MSAFCWQYRQVSASNFRRFEMGVIAFAERVGTLIGRFGLERFPVCSFYLDILVCRIPVVREAVGVELLADGRV